MLLCVPRMGNVAKSHSVQPVVDPGFAASFAGPVPPVSAPSTKISLPPHPRARADKSLQTPSRRTSHFHRRYNKDRRRSHETKSELLNQFFTLSTLWTSQPRTFRSSCWLQKQALSSLQHGSPSTSPFPRADHLVSPLTHRPSRSSSKQAAQSRDPMCPSTLVGKSLPPSMAT